MKDKFGRHLIVDGVVKDSEIFNEEHINKMFFELVKELKMEIILGPIHKKVELDKNKINSDVFQDDGGISSFIMISTSHIAIHCWPLRNYFSMDIFSCKDFDSLRAFDIVNKLLDIEKCSHNSSKRPSDGKQII